MGNALDEEMFTDTKWRLLFQDQPEAIKKNLLKLAALDRYGAILSHLDDQTKELAMISLVGSAILQDSPLLYLTEYLRCCFEIEGKVPQILDNENFSVAIGEVVAYYHHHLYQILQDLTIDSSFVTGTKWEIALNKLKHYREELQGDNSSEIKIVPEDKEGRITTEDRSVRFGFRARYPYYRIGRNILALAAAERYKGIFIFLDNGQPLPENPGGIAFSRLTGMIAHPNEFPFKRALNGGSSIPNAVINSLKDLDEGSIDEYRFFKNALDCTCLNQLCTSISEFWKKYNETNSYHSIKEFVIQAGLAFQTNILKQLGLLDIPRNYSEPGYRMYHMRALLENFLEFIPNQFDLDSLPFAYEESEAREIASETLGLYSVKEVGIHLKTDELRTHLSAAEYRGLWKGIYKDRKLNVNTPLQRGHSFTYPLHVAARKGDQTLISLLIDLGAILDLTDYYGNVARQYALGLSFEPRTDRQMLSVLESPDVKPMIRDYQRLRLAVGSWNVKIQIGNGPRQSLFQYAWEHFLFHGTASEKIAAKMILERLAFDGTNSSKFEYLAGSKHKMNRLLNLAQELIQKFAKEIDRLRKQNKKEPSFIQCIERNPWLLNLWLPLTNLLQSSFLSTEESTYVLYFAGKYRIALKELIAEAQSGRMPHSLLFLFPFLSRTPYLSEIIEYHTAKLSTPSLTYKISRTYFRLALLHERHSQAAERMSGEIAKYILSNLPNGSEAVAAFLTNDKFSTSLKCCPRELLRCQLTRNQTLSLDKEEKARLFKEILKDRKTL